MKIVPWKQRDKAAAAEKERQRQFCTEAIELIRSSVLPVTIIEKRLGEFAAKGQRPTLEDLSLMRGACRDYVAQIQEAAETARRAFEAAK